MTSMLKVGTFVVGAVGAATVATLAVNTWTNERGSASKATPAPTPQPSAREGIRASSDDMSAVLTAADLVGKLPREVATVYIDRYDTGPRDGEIEFLDREGSRAEYVLPSPDGVGGSEHHYIQTRLFEHADAAGDGNGRATKGEIASLVQDARDGTDASNMSAPLTVNETRALLRENGERASVLNTTASPADYWERDPSLKP